MKACKLTRNHLNPRMSIMPVRSHHPTSRGNPGNPTVLPLRRPPSLLSLRLKRSRINPKSTCLRPPQRRIQGSSHEALKRYALLRLAHSPRRKTIPHLRRQTHVHLKESNHNLTTQRPASKVSPLFLFICRGVAHSENKLGKQLTMNI